jgi:hypothetical protein
MPPLKDSQNLSFRAKHSGVEESLIVEHAFINSKRCLDFARHDKKAMEMSQ